MDVYYIYHILVVSTNKYYTLIITESNITGHNPCTYLLIVNKASKLGWEGSKNSELNWKQTFRKVI